LLARTVMVRRGLCLTSAVVVSALWVALEALRGSVPWGGLPWGASAFALADSPLLHLAPWIGIAGLAFVVALLGQLLLFGALAMVGVPHPINRAPVDRPTMTVAAVQGSMGEIDPVSYTMPDDVFPNHLDVTHDVIEQTEAKGTALDLIVWPEDSTGWDPRQD